MLVVVDDGELLGERARGVSGVVEGVVIGVG